MVKAKKNLGQSNTYICDWKDCFDIDIASQSSLSERVSEP